jgi:general L-amino acid transport system substrate-binding protein
MNARSIVGSASCVLAAALLIGIPSVGAAGSNRLADIQARGTLNCGIWPYVPGFATERDGRYQGFDVDICRAVAAAIFGDPTKVRFVPLAHVRQFIERNDIDLAVRRLTWTLRREMANGMTFGPIIFYDGQGFLVAKQSGIRSVSQLIGERICVINTERHPETLYNYFRDGNHEIQIISVESDKEAEESLDSNRCRAYSADVSWLAAARSNFSDGLTRYDILSDQISKEPLAPLMRVKDTALVELVRWTVFAMIEAEELNLNSHNIDTVSSSSSRVRSFLSIYPGRRVASGAGGWARAIIVGVGNYGEVFDRNLGTGSPIKLDRGLNRLWSQGGLMYSPPLDR